MDETDQEVVREPFECHIELASSPYSHQPRFDVDEQHESLEVATSPGYANLSSNITDDRYTDEDDDSSSNASVEAVDFAKSFGIQLKTHNSRAQSAYERLLDSDQFNSNGQATVASTTKSNDQQQGKPLIKTSITSDCIYHKGTFYQKGDIVALYDSDDGRVYFAQLSGFLQDQFCEKSASLNWLVPTRPTSREFFDPTAYRIGLEDSRLIKLDCMTFVRHCPHDYYVNKFFQAAATAVPSTSSNNQQASGSSSCVIGSSVDKSHARINPATRSTNKAFIWTTMESCKVPTINKEC